MSPEALSHHPSRVRQHRAGGSRAPGARGRESRSASPGDEPQSLTADGGRHLARLPVLSVSCEQPPLAAAGAMRSVRTRPRNSMDPPQPSPNADNLNGPGSLGPTADRARSDRPGPGGSGAQRSRCRPGRRRWRRPGCWAPARLGTAGWSRSGAAPPARSGLLPVARPGPTRFGRSPPHQQQSPKDRVRGRTGLEPCLPTARPGPAPGRPFSWTLWASHSVFTFRAGSRPPRYTAPPVVSDQRLWAHVSPSRPLLDRRLFRRQTQTDVGIQPARDGSCFRRRDTQPPPRLV